MTITAALLLFAAGLAAGYRLPPLAERWRRNLRRRRFRPVLLQAWRPEHDAGRADTETAE